MGDESGLPPTPDGSLRRSEPALVTAAEVRLTAPFRWRAAAMTDRPARHLADCGGCGSHRDQGYPPSTPLPIKAHPDGSGLLLAAGAAALTVVFGSDCLPAPRLGSARSNYELIVKLWPVHEH
jgi:hypothetical protein